MLRLLPHFGRGPTVSEPAAAPASVEVLARLAAMAENWTPAEAAELRSLAGERDAELFHEGLLHFSGRLERRGRHAESQTLLGVLAEGAEDSVAGRARSRLSALRGDGEMGARVEVLLSRFAAEATEPAALFAMGGAGAIYRFSRFALLGRLALTPSHFLTRGWGARTLASSLAFSVEATSFPLLARSAHAALGRRQDWSAEILSHEIAGSFCVLGGLKVAGAGGAYLRQRLVAGPSAAWLGPVFQQGSMLGGILAGHRLEEWTGLRAPQAGATTLIDSLALLLQFNVAGRLSRNLFGEGFQRWEREIDRRSQALGPRPIRGGEFPVTPFPRLDHPVPVLAMSEARLPPGIEMMNIEGQGAAGGASRPGSPRLRLPKMGLRGSWADSPVAESLNRQEAERVLRELVPQAFSTSDLERPGFVENLLGGFGITAHAFDVQAFRDGYEVARKHPERVSRLAFDFDEVYLHWAFGPRDLLRRMADGAEGAYYHTPRKAVEYESMLPTEGPPWNPFEKAWYEGIQKLFPMAFRQHLQFHPGARAFQLGLRLGQDRNLLMVTVGPAGRLMRLANEDPALKMIYFGRLPTETVTLGEVRGSTNIYTREDIALALRETAKGEALFSGHPLMENYLETLRRFPEQGDRIKHPALALLRGKRPFDALVDDSSFAPRALAEVPGFRVFQVPSARPARTKNFTFGSTEAYLSRSANGYVRSLAERLLDPNWVSGPLENLPAPPDYRFQRLAIEMPWTKFGAGYVAMGKEARAWSRRLAEGESAPRIRETGPQARAPLSLSESQLHTLTERLHREFEILLERRAGEVSIEARNTLMLKDMAAASPEAFQDTLDTYFSPEEQVLLPQFSRPSAERGEKFYSRIASLMAAKAAVCNLLALDVAEHAQEVRFRFGRPLLRGLAAQRLNGSSMLTTLSDDGEVGIGIALLEPSFWDSGLVGIGLDLTTDRVSYTTPGRHTLAEAAFKATYPAHTIRQFNHHRTGELVQDGAGNVALTGQSMQAARHLRGDYGIDAPLPVHSLNFRVGRATVGLVAIPALDPPRAQPGAVPRPADFPYLVDERGDFHLARPGLTVAVLGDVNATRTLELVRRGHYVFHVERDPDMAELAERMVKVFLKAEGHSIGKASDNSVIRGDWYDTGTNADLVEAYFPLALGDIPRRGDFGRREALREFLEAAIHSKLANGGSAFIVSEVQEHIEDLARLVRTDDRLRLLEVRYNAPRPPLVGGFSPLLEGERMHYLVYRKGSNDPLP